MIPVLRELRRLGGPTLRVLFERVPVHVASAAEDLIAQWDPMVRNYSRQYGTPKFPVEDMAQELRMVVVTVAKSVDPVRRSSEFGRVLRTSMRNRCVDIVRAVRAQKRQAVTGRSLHCMKCDTISTWVAEMDPVCGGCGTYGKVGSDTDDIKWVISRANDASLDAPSSPSRDSYGTEDGGAIGDMMEDRSTVDPLERLGSTELLDKVRAKLNPYPDRALFNLRMDPPPEFTRFLAAHTQSSRVNLNKVPFWLSARYLGLRQDKFVRAALLRIGVVVAEVLGRNDLFPEVSRN